MPALSIEIGHCYSNGAYGRAWGVRLVQAVTRDAERGVEMVHFKGVAGACRRKTGQCTLDEFRRWAKYEVCLNENSWQRVGAADAAP